MKPFPCSKKAFLEEVNSLKLLEPNASTDKPRKKLIKCIHNSMKIQRSFNRVSIVLVGTTGVGKSATINHLLGVDLATTSRTKSNTRSTKEFIVHGSDPKYEVEGLSLGLVDTPGFCDTDGTMQDACNLLSMQKFFTTHPTLSKYYPNLIFLVLKATDNRIMGDNSELGKSLRCIKALGLVDLKNPNVVAILTHACSIPHGNVKEWTVTLDEVKSNVSKLVFNYLQVSAPVVVIENDYKGWKLKRRDDYTRLPNKDWQPKNLYVACASLLEHNKDSLGLITLNSIFLESEQVPRRVPISRHETEAKNANQFTLDSEEKAMVEKIEMDGRGSKDCIHDIISQYITEEDLKADEKEEVMKIATILRRFGKGNPLDFGSHSLSSIEFFLGKEISLTGRNMLKKKFNIPMEPPCKLREAGRLVGQGYNILTGRSVAAEVMKFDVTTKYGMAIPTCAKFEKVQQSRSFMEVFEDEESYTKSRLMSLGVNLAVRPGIFKMDFRAGYNKKSRSTSSSSISEYSFLFEQLLFELKIGNYKEYLKHGMAFTEDFKSAVEKLPSVYDKHNDSCVSNFHKFFNRFGHFLVSSAYGGGSVEVKCSREAVERSNIETAKAYLAATLEGLDVGGIGLSAEGGTFDSKKTKNLLERSTYSWVGGEVAFQMNETIGDKEKLQQWKESLIVNPTMLTSEMTLEPISTALGCLDSQKEEATYHALKDLLKCDICEKEEIHAEEEEKNTFQKISNYLKDAYTRLMTIIQPNLDENSCFPLTSVVSVQRKDGEVKQKKMANLDVGDNVMAWDEKRNKAVFSKVMMFAHLAPDAMVVEYLKITLEDGNKITLSGNHLVMVGKQKKAVLARKVKPGDFLFSVDENREISPKKVLAVEKVVEQGIYCPITVHGNVIVDNVLASCYASVEDHVLLKGLVKISAQSMAHLGLMPMRALHKLRSKWLREIPNGQTIHPYLQWLCKLNLPWMAK